MAFYNDMYVHDLDKSVLALVLVTTQFIHLVPSSLGE